MGMRWRLAVAIGLAALAASGGTAQTYDDRPAKPVSPNYGFNYERRAVDIPMPGHRIMVQVQSSWFPLYDRNPQTFVPNIFLARPADYMKATQRVWVSGPSESYVALPGVK
jgi:hypothetical protein